MHLTARRVAGAIAGYVLLASTTVAVADGQTRLSIRSEQPSCAACTIELSPFMTLGNGDERNAFPALFRTAAITPDGSVVVLFIGALPRLYDQRGQFVREFGRKGSGPGDLNEPVGAAVLGKDTVVFVERGRLSLFSLSGRFLNTVPVSGTWSTGILPVGSKLVLPGSFTSGGKRYQLTLVDLRTGAQEFAADEPPSDLPFDSFRTRRALAIRREGGIWSGHILSYTVDSYTLTGEVTQVIQRSASWFEDYESRQLPPLSPQQRPPSYLRSLQEDESGLLWVLTNVPRSGWAKGLSAPVMRQPNRPTYRIVDDTLFFESHIEVLDVKKQTVVASVVIPGRELNYIGRGIIAGIVRDADDVEQLRIWRVRLARPR